MNRKKKLTPMQRYVSQWEKETIEQLVRSGLTVEQALARYYTDGLISQVPMEIHLDEANKGRD